MGIRKIDVARGIQWIEVPDADRDALGNAFDALVDYTHYHFGAEEKLMALYAYPGAEGHGKRHAGMVLQVAAHQKRILGGNAPEKAVFRQFFESWLVRHILNEDRKYGAFLNAKGVY